MKEIFQYSIRTLCPLHIGCGDVFEPTSYVVNPDTKELAVFDVISFVMGLSIEKQKELSNITSNGNVDCIKKIYEFFEKANPAKDNTHVRYISVSREFVQHFKTVFNKSGRDLESGFKQFEINRTSFLTEDFRPYIPGSAIKGGIRTAYLNFINSVGNTPPASGREEQKRLHQQAKTVEEKLLQYEQDKTFKNDPFRLVKVSDFVPVGDVKTKIVYAVNRKKHRMSSQVNSQRNTGDSGAHTIIEVIEPGAEFTGTIVIDDPRGSDIKKPITMDVLLESLNQFFKQELEREQSEIYHLNPAPLEKMKGEGNICRIGRYSGAECITINGKRSIKIRQNRYEKSATTVWLASDAKSGASLEKFGWVELVRIPLSGSNYAQTLTEKEQIYKDSYLRAKNERLMTIKCKEERREQECIQRELQEQERKAKKELEEKKKAERAQMPEEERNIARLEDTDIEESEVVTIYQTLDSLSGDVQKRIALALKNYYQRQNKWDLKQVSDKQKKKITKIKKILGE